MIEKKLFGTQMLTKKKISHVYQCVQYTLYQNMVQTSFWYTLVHKCVPPDKLSQFKPS